MTLRRWLGIWVMLLVGGTAIALTSFNRQVRLAESVGDSDVQRMWAELPASLGLIYLGVTALSLGFLVLGVPGKLNQRRLHRTAPADGAVIRGFWNFAASEEWRGPLFGFPRLSAISTVLVATPDGIQLVAGFFPPTLRIRFDWESVEDITVVHFDMHKRVVPGPGIAIRLSNFEKPLVFSVIAESFPWFAVGSAQFTQETASALRVLLHAARGR